MHRLAWLLLPLALVGCHLCEYRLEEGPSALVLPRGSACPAASDVDPSRLNDKALEVESFDTAIDDPGQQQCCYQAHIHEPAIDEVMTVALDLGPGCASESGCPCPSRSSLLASPDRARLDGVPEGGDVVDVVGGPTPLYAGYCEYEARVTRPPVDRVERRCQLVAFEKDAFDVGACAPPSALVGESSPLAGGSRESVTAIDGGASIDVARSSMPSRRCVYRVKYEETADVCG